MKTEDTVLHVQMLDFKVSQIVMFLPQSWYGRDRKMPTTGYPSRRPKSICSSTYYTIKLW